MTPAGASSAPPPKAAATPPSTPMVSCSAGQDSPSKAGSDYGPYKPKIAREMKPPTPSVRSGNSAARIASLEARLVRL